MTAEFDELFQRLTTQTQRIASGDIPVPDPETTPVEVVGIDPEGLVAVQLINGRCTAVEVHTNALRGDHVLADLIRDAVNAALDAHLAQVMEQISGPQTDFGQLTDELRAIQVDSLKAMDNFTDGMQEALRQAVRLSQ